MARVDPMEAIAHSLGDDDRDFREQPLTQAEVLSVYHTFSKELTKKLAPELKTIYQECIKILKEQIVFH